jgi:hypothetical protein
LVIADKFDEDQYGVKYASECEVCKLVSSEFMATLSESSKTHETLETGYSVEKSKKKTKYKESELRLIETMERLCDRFLQYNIHKERTDSSRFARGVSETFQTLEGLVSKGVKVDIGIPHELWHKPSAEVTQLKVQCETLMEQYESDVEDWYFGHQDETTLEDYLCKRRALKSKDQQCLNEKGEAAAANSDSKSKKKSSKKKKDSKSEL